MNEKALKSYKNKLVDTLASFDAFCSNHALRYFACSGTAIGAIRHKGFIPWDDDVDVYMPRSDYDRLLSLRHLLNGTNYTVKSLGDKEYIYAFAKYYDITTTLVETDTFPNCVIGVYVDVFPLDEVSGSFEEIYEKKNNYSVEYRHFQDTYLKISKRMILSCLYHRDFIRLKKLFSILLMSSQRKMIERSKFLQIEAEWSKEKGNLVMTHSCIYPLEKELFPKSWFDDYIYVDFENIKIRLSNHYDEYLTHLFGDYMTPPPKENRVSDHSHFYLNLKEGLVATELKKRIKNGERLVY